jgi:hypothetical protein
MICRFWSLGFRLGTDDQGHDLGDVGFRVYRGEAVRSFVFWVYRGEVVRCVEHVRCDGEHDQTNAWVWGVRFLG